MVVFNNYKRFGAHNWPNVASPLGDNPRPTFPSYPWLRDDDRSYLDGSVQAYYRAAVSPGKSSDCVTLATW